MPFIFQFQLDFIGMPSQNFHDLFTFLDSAFYYFFRNSSIEKIDRESYPNYLKLLALAIS